MIDFIHKNEAIIECITKRTFNGNNAFIILDQFVQQSHFLKNNLTKQNRQFLLTKSQSEKYLERNSSCFLIAHFMSDEESFDFFYTHYSDNFRYYARFLSYFQLNGEIGKYILEKFKKDSTTDHFLRINSLSCLFSEKNEWAMEFLDSEYSRISEFLEKLTIISSIGSWWDSEVLEQLFSLEKSPEIKTLILKYLVIQGKTNLLNDNHFGDLKKTSGLKNLMIFLIEAPIRDYFNLYTSILKDQKYSVLLMAILAIAYYGNPEIFMHLPLLLEGKHNHIKDQFYSVYGIMSGLRWNGTYNVDIENFIITVKRFDRTKRYFNGSLWSPVCLADYISQNISEIGFVGSQLSFALGKNCLINNNIGLLNNYEKISRLQDNCKSFDQSLIGKYLYQGKEYSNLL